MVDKPRDLYERIEDVVPPDGPVLAPNGRFQAGWWKWFWIFRKRTDDNFTSAGVNALESALLGQVEDLRAQVDGLRLQLGSLCQDRQQDLAVISALVQQNADLAVASVQSVGQDADAAPVAIVPAQDFYLPATGDLDGRLAALESVMLGLLPGASDPLSDLGVMPRVETGHLTIRDYFERFATVTANRDAANGTGNQIILAGSASGASPLAPVSLSAAAGSTDTNVGVAIVPKGTGAFMLAVPDNGTGGGNVRGTNAVDLQTSRTAATAVAAGASSFAAGLSNTVSGTGAAAVGNSNNVSGAASVALGLGNAASGNGSIVLGSRGTDRGTHGSRVMAPGRLSVSGDVQFQEADFFVTTAGAVAVRLTTDGLTAAATNVMVLPNNSGYAVECVCIIRDVTGGKQLVYMRAFGLIERGANAAATALGATPPAFALLDSSAAPPILAVIPTLTADTTLGGLNISFTPPALNTNTFHAHCYVRAVQVL